VAQWCGYRGPTPHYQGSTLDLSTRTLFIYSQVRQRIHRRWSGSPWHIAVGCSLPTASGFGDNPACPRPVTQTRQMTGTWPHASRAASTEPCHPQLACRFGPRAVFSLLDGRIRLADVTIPSFPNTAVLVPFRSWDGGLPRRTSRPDCRRHQATANA
jgi:hypothetical protein